MSKPNPVVHFEMGYNDKDRMIAFYQNVFGWETKPMGEEMGNYVVAHTAATDDNGMILTPGAINGGFYKKAGPSSQAPSIVVSVDEIREAMRAVIESGGTILGSMNEDGQHSDEPQMIPGVGLWISAMDTEENRFSIMQPNA